MQLGREGGKGRTEPPAALGPRSASCNRRRRSSCPCRLPWGSRRGWHEATSGLEERTLGPACGLRWRR
eukprot:761623-Hanusia_phi.AAC.1